jgi:hypothetical protein
VDEGLGFTPDSEGRWDSSREARRVRPGLFGRDDRWDLLVSG